MSSDVVESGQPFLLEGNEVGVMLSHGFTGTTSSMKSLGEYLHRSEGWTVLCPRLSGHGETPEAMAATTAGDWIQSLEEGLEVLKSRCNDVLMAGLSMGGCLTLYLAAMHSDAFKAIAPINACLYFDAPDFAALAFDRKAPAATRGFGSDVKDPATKEMAYSVVPTPCIQQIYGLMAVTRDLLPRVTAPTLVLASSEDHVVPPENSAEILRRIGSVRREMLVLKNSFHVATIDHDKDLINESIRRFFRDALSS
jgi:carboxylesterase